MMNEQTVTLKNALADAIERKKKNTQDRLSYKKATPVSDPSRFTTLTRFWSQGSNLKGEIRCLSLAYAFLKGHRYWVAERVVKNPAYATGIALALGDVSRKEEIQTWLSEKPSEEERLEFAQFLARANEAARQASQARAAARRAA